MPRSQGTSRKGKPKKSERAAGMGRALERSQLRRFKPKSNGSGGGGGMAATGARSIGIEAELNEPKIKSVLEVDNLTDFLTQSEMANREFASEKERFVVLDDVGKEYDPSKPQVRFLDESYKPPTNFQFKELSVPRRPKWTSETTATELHSMENEAFLEWRRALAHQEEKLHAMNTNTVVTPFEKNLEVWRQLWRVLERSSCLIQIVDARNPLFYFSEDLRAYAEVELGKPMLLVINKSDYLTYEQRKAWNRYFTNLGVHHLFFSAYEEQKILDGEAQRKKKEDWLENKFFDEALKQQDDEGKIDNIRNEGEKNQERLDGDDLGISSLITREGLLHHLHAFAVSNKCKPSPTSGRIEFGTIGFPNVGKSSIINVLIGASKHEHNTVRVGVAAQPGKTKHFQTILLEEPFEKMMLCDCPGLVFPSFVSSTADLIAAGVFPLSQMREGQSKDVVRLIVERTPIEIFEAMYGIQIPRMTMEGKLPMTADLLLDTFCVTRSMLNAASGTPDHQRASRLFIKDYVSGKLLYCHPPPADASNDAKEENKKTVTSTFEKETFTTLFNRTGKVKEKLGNNIPTLGDENIEDNPIGGEEGEGELDGGDLDILDLLDELDNGGGGIGSDDILLDDKKKSSKKKKHFNKPPTKKWGKKGKKYRNKDPYGCHTDPDPLMYSSQTSGAIAGGKYGGQYTRPNYAGARNAIPHTRKTGRGRE